MNIRWIKPALLSAALCATLGACASLPDDRGQGQTQSLLKSHSMVAGQSPLNSVNNDVQSLTREPLDADACVRIALLRNPLMRSWYAQLGLAQADVYDATRLSNPSVGFGQLSADGRVTKTTWSISQPITELLFLKFNTQVARAEVLQTQQRIANEVLLLEAQTRRDYYRYVGAALVTQMRAKAASAALASSQFAQRLYDAGNISQLQLSREQAAASAADIAQRTAQAQAFAARGELLTSLGLTLDDNGGDQSIAFVEQMPLPSSAALDNRELQAWALQQRLDLTATRTALESVQRNVKHARRWWWFGGVELGADWEREGGDQWAAGPHANLELPLFNHGGGAVLRAQARVESLAAQLDALELATRNDIVVQVAALDEAAAIVDEYRQRLVPLQQQIVTLSQQQQNFMLIGAFELLSAKQNELNTYQSYLEAVRDYWLAHTELIRSAGGALPKAADESGVMIGIEDGIETTMGATP